MAAGCCRRAFQAAPAAMQLLSSAGAGALGGCALPLQQVWHGAIQQQPQQWQPQQSGQQRRHMASDETKGVRRSGGSADGTGDGGSEGSASGSSGGGGGGQPAAREQQPEGPGPGAPEPPPAPRIAVGPDDLATVPWQVSTTGYVETFLARAPEGDSREQRGEQRRVLQQRHAWAEGELSGLPQELEQLRVRLGQPVPAEEAEAQADAYTLSRSLTGGDAGPAQQPPAGPAAADGGPAAAAAGQQQQLSAADRELLEKLVGVLTKDGKKSRARRILLDAMHIIRQQLAQGQQQQRDGTA